MELTNDKQILIKKIVQNLTSDLQENLYRSLDALIDDDLDINQLTEDITFTLHKNYRLDAITCKNWVTFNQVNYK